ncbi:MAG: FAD-dependent oxidoreductase [Ignavibacteria bacterium]|nr:FAD-dependent oxidoreductase [Ignavibacteria bacterium]
MEENIITLKERKMLCENTIGMWFNYSNIEYDFEPGQYTQITLLEPIHTDDEGNSRLFSIASSPTNKETLLFATRALDSAFNKNILEMPLGAKAKLGNTGGNTLLHKDSSIPAVFLIGGIGITPVRCIVEYVTNEKLPYEIYLFYSSPKNSSAVFLNEFEKWAVENPNFKLFPTIDDESDKNWKYDYGFINEEMIKKHIKDTSIPIYYVVGPPAMVDAMLDILSKFGVDNKNIKFERFG